MTADRGVPPPLRAGGARGLRRPGRLSLGRGRRPKVGGQVCVVRVVTHHTDDTHLSSSPPQSRGTASQSRGTGACVLGGGGLDDSARLGLGVPTSSCSRRRAHRGAALPATPTRIAARSRRPRPGGTGAAIYLQVHIMTYLHIVHRYCMSPCVGIILRCLHDSYRYGVYLLHTYKYLPTGSLMAAGSGLQVPGGPRRADCPAGAPSPSWGFASPATRRAGDSHRDSSEST